MVSEKWYNKKVTGIPLIVVFTILVIYTASNWLFNLGVHQKVNTVAVCVISCGVIGVFLLSAHAIRLYHNRLRKHTGLLLLITLWLGFPVLAIVVVKFLLPMLGVQLEKGHVPFRWSEFLAKTYQALFTVMMMSVGYYFFYRKLLSERRENALREVKEHKKHEISSLKIKALFRNIRDHYGRHVLGDVATRAELNDENYTAKQIAHVIRTNDYVMDAIQNSGLIVSIHTALIQFQDVVDSIRLRRGNDDRVIEVTRNGDPSMQVIGALTLTTLLENSDTHGWVDAEHPIQVNFIFGPGLLVFTCKNFKRPEGQQVRSSGEGLQYVREELAQLGRHLPSLSYREDAHTYTVYLIIYYT